MISRILNFLALGVTCLAVTVQAQWDANPNGVPFLNANTNKYRGLFYNPDGSPIPSVSSSNTFYVLQASVNTKGTGVQLNDTLTVVGGTGSAATFTASAVSFGLVNGVTLLSPGSYSVMPANPVSITSTHGSGVKLNLVWSTNYTPQYTGLFYNPDGSPVTSGTNVDLKTLTNAVASLVQSATNVTAYNTLQVTNPAGGSSLITSSNVQAVEFIGSGAKLTGIQSANFGLVSTNAATNYVRAFLPFTNGSTVYYIPLLQTNVGGTALVLTNGVVTGSGGITPSNLIAWYRLENNFNDCASNHSYNLTASGSPTFSAGQFGQAAVFVSSSSQHADSSGVITELGGVAHFTVSAWLNRATSGSSVALQYVTGNLGFGINAYTDGFVYFTCSDGTGGGAAYQQQSDSNTGWIMWTMVYDGTQTGQARLTLYKNGVLFSPTAFNLTPPATMPSAAAMAGTLFKLGYNGAGFSDGMIDDVRIYSTSLTQAQVADTFTNSAYVCAP